MNSYVEVNLDSKVEYLFAFLKGHATEKCAVFFSTIEQVKFAYKLAKTLNFSSPVFELHGKLCY